MLKDKAPKARVGTIKAARALRRTMTLPEVLLWRVLRQSSARLKFRRQHPSGRYVLDFYCSDARLAIEIDGIAHDRGERSDHDAARDAWFASAGIMTIRLPAANVLRDVALAADGIISLALARLPLHHPAAPGGPPPRDELGEDQGAT